MSDVVLLSDCRSQGCRDWVRAGRPYADSQPIAQFKETVAGHGFTVYTYPDKSHLTAATPEDHTSFSATGWPTPAPRWIGNAADVMPRGDSVAARNELARLARQIIADKDAGVPGTEWIKYINWTDESGACWQTSWKPGKHTVRSTDKGHIHMSGLSTWVGKKPAAWDPVARLAGGTTTGEDDDMGATYMNGQIPDTSGYPYNIDLGIVGAGAADPRAAWLSFTNDLDDDFYALRVVWTAGDNNYQALAFEGASNFGYDGTVFKKGIRGWVQLPDGAVALSVTRQAVQGGKPVSPEVGGKPYPGSISFAIERGAVGSK